MADALDLGSSVFGREGSSPFLRTTGARAADIVRGTLTVGDVPVDGFWSVSVYNSAGFFEPNARATYTVNSVTGVRDEDGTITIRFGDYPEGTPNAVPIVDGWNYLVRLYRPRAEILEGRWSFPSLQI